MDSSSVVSVSVPNKTLDQTITRLRSQKKKAIECLDYEEAQRIEQKINKLRDDDTTDRLAEVRENFQCDIEACIQRSQKQAEKLLSKKEQEILDTRRKFSQMFKDAQKANLEELAKLEQQYSESRMQENERRVPEQIKMLEQSKKLATIGQFQEALAMRDQSRLVAQQNLKERLEILDEAFDKNRATILATQGTQYLNLGNKLQEALELIETANKKQQSKDNSNREAQLLVLLQKASNKVAALVQGNKAKRILEMLKTDLLDICEQYECPAPGIKQNKINKSAKTSEKSSRIPSKSSRR